MKPSVRAGLAAVVAAAVALGVAELVAVVTGPLSAPLLAVGGVIVDIVPAPVKDVGVQVFGVYDKVALLTGTAVLLAGYAYGLGVVARRRWWLAVVGIALFAVVGVLAATTRHDAGLVAGLPSLVGAGLAVGVLRYLLRFADPQWPAAGGNAGTALAETSPSAAGPSAAAQSAAAPSAAAEVVPPTITVRPADEAVSRRRFVRALGIAAGASVVLGVSGRLLTGRRAVTQARAALSLPTPAQPAPPLPAGVQVEGVTPYVSPNRDFYRIDTALYPPQIDPATWQLRIHGMVRNPITITWEQLLRRPMIERYVTLACVSNDVGGPLIGNALWLGTPLKALLDEADPLPGADQVVQRSADGWTCGTPTAVLRDGRDALLAIGMNGQPLPVEHGFPVRAVVPGLYGYVSACKWVTELQLTRFADFDAYWVPRGWAQQAPIKTQSRIDTPRDGSRRPAGTVMVAGVAWAQHRGIAKVEVQVDSGPWQEATLAPTVSTDTWRQWSFPWSATAGEHVVRVRATDADGQTQTGAPHSSNPDGATGWHKIEVTVD